MHRKKFKGKIFNKNFNKKKEKKLSLKIISGKNNKFKYFFLF
jgi:hypothetical protein